MLHGEMWPVAWHGYDMSQIFTDCFVVLGCFRIAAQIFGEGTWSKPQVRTAQVKQEGDFQAENATKIYQDSECDRFSLKKPVFVHISTQSHMLPQSAIRICEIRWKLVETCAKSSEAWSNSDCAWQTLRSTFETRWEEFQAADSSPPLRCKQSIPFDLPKASKSFVTSQLPPVSSGGYSLWIWVKCAWLIYLWLFWY